MERKCKVYIKLQLVDKIINDFEDKAIEFKEVCTNYSL